MVQLRQRHSIESQESPARLVAMLPHEEREDFIKSLTADEAETLLYDWNNFLARPDQKPPEGNWDIWCILSGRGWGKTRTGAEWLKDNIESGHMRRVAIVGETAADVRDVMVEGESGILSCYPPGKRPIYKPSRRQIIWPWNGAVASIYNATRPDQLRGPQHDGAWSDELAKWQYARETWDQLQFGMRLGDNPRQLVTTTPRPIELVKAIVSGDEGVVHVTTGRTLDNAGNLPEKFLNKIISKYKGTRLGRQELDGIILGDFPNALWTQGQIDVTRISNMPKDVARTVVAVDPSVTDPDDLPDSDDAPFNGIAVCAQDSSGERGYVLEDASIQGSPAKWARRALAMYDHYSADAIVVEINNGGVMVKDTILSIRTNVNIVEVRASRGKHVRAEPISSMYEQGRISHIGSFPDLEDQMCLMTSAGFKGEGSPDRVDAMVWGFTELFEEMLIWESETKVPRWKPRRVV